MDFETAGKGVNPFLMEDLTDYSSPTNASSNPFLTSTEYTIPQTSDNPFLSNVGASPFAADSGPSTNPFADFSSSYEPSANNIFGDAGDSGGQDYGNIFSSATQDDFFGAASETIQPEVVSRPQPARPEVPPPPRVAEEDHGDFCNETSEIFGAEAGRSEPPGPPRRPPPPRPVPPSKETKDLILSVTGAMEATSSHLLDRLQATRTPSPTPMRDINTPSPTMDAHYGDLLDTGETRLPAFPSQVDLSMMNEPPSGGPAPPPRPQKPPESQHDMFDMFGTSEPLKPIVPTSTADIISLFNQPQAKPIEAQADLLGDDFGPEISSLQPDLMSGDFVSQEIAPPAVATTPVQAKDESFAAMGNEFEAIPADTYPEVNDNIPHTTASTVDAPEIVETFQPFSEKKKSIPEIIKPKIPETFVSNVPDTFTSEISDSFGTNMTDSYSPSTDPCGTALQDNFGSMNPDSFDTEQKETFSALSDTFTSAIPDSFGTTISDTFGSTVTSTYVSSNITDNIGTTAQDTFSSTIPSIFGTDQDTFGSNTDGTYSSVQDTFVTNVDNTFGSVQDTFGSNVDNTFGSTQDTFGSNVDNTFGSVQDTFGSVQDTFGSTVDNTFGSVQDNTFGSNVDNTFGSVQDTFGSNVDNTFSSVQDTFGSNVDNTFGSVQGNTFSNVDDTFGSVQDENAYGSNVNEAFGSAVDAFGSAPRAAPQGGGGRGDDFDAFSAKFDNIGALEPQEAKAAEDPFDPFASAAASAPAAGSDAWGSAAAGGEVTGGFEADESFDAFLSMNGPPPPPPARTKRHGSGDSDEQKDFSVVIKPRMEGEAFMPTPALAPPPKSPVNNSVAFADNTSRFNPFDKSLEFAQPALPLGEPEGALARTDSQETPPTPLFDEDVSQPLEDFPRVHYSGEGWEMHLRQPNKKKITGQRFWKKVFVKLVHQGDSPVLQLYNTKDDKDPFQELPLQACYSVSDIGAQQYDNFGKIFTVKLQYVFYKERPGIRPGQVTKAERITNKLSQFAAYAIQGDYQGCKEFGSDLKKLGMPVEHAPQISQLFKLGCQSYDDLKTFSVQVEESLFRLAVHRDRALNYKTEEVQITAVDELHVEQDEYGRVEKQIARVRLFFLGFLAGMPDVELGVNDMWRQGKEVVGRHDIIPVVTEEWIRLEMVEFHTCVQLDEYEKTHVIKFKPPDACYLELMRFRVRPPKNRELPLQVKTVMCVTGNKVELKCDILVPGFSSRKLGQVPCEDVMVRFPIPECWIYLFRVEKHFRYGSVKSTHRRTGKVKGIERFLGAVETFEQSLIEVTSGQAKYEHQHRAIVWRMARLPKEGQGAYTTHNLVCRMGLTSFDQIPDKLAEFCYVEFTMPATQVSHMTVRSVSLSNSAKDDPPEKYVRQLARHEYRVGIEHTQGEGPGAYLAATITKPAAPVAPPVVDQLDMPEPIAESDSDSSS